MKPAHVIALGFLALILVGSLLLSLPISTKSGEWNNYLTALFTSTSAVCVTGLIAVDTATYFSVFGQIVILLLIQAGGLGFMSITTMLMLLLRRKITLKDRLVIQEALNQDSSHGLVKLTRNIVYMTLIIEGIGALMLLPSLVVANGAVGVWQSIFTSVSAFCNAGFDIFGATQGQFSSLTAFSSSALVCLPVCMLIILGGMGFSVIMDIGRAKFRFSRLTLHSRVVLVTTLILILGGWAFFFGKEYGASMQGMSAGDKLLNSFFQSVTTRTAGFNTIDQDGMTSASKLVTMLLMFIGASPGSTGGGIKTTTIAILLLAVVAGVRSTKEVVVAKRTVNIRSVLKSVSVLITGLAVVFIATLILLVTETGHVPPDMLTLDNMLFESFSAFGTVGLSTGVTPYLSGAGKIILMCLMFFGRVGTVTMGLLLIARKQGDQITYPDGHIMIG